MNEKSKSASVAKINFKHIKVSYLVTFLLCAFIAIDILGGYFWKLTDEGTVKVSLGNYLYLFIILAPILISAKNFHKIMNLNGKKKDFYWGCLINYSVFAITVSALNILFYYFFDPLFNSRFTTVNLIAAFGWTANGMFLAFIQQSAFLLLCQVFLHTLTSIQNSWVGWAVDILIIAIISVFTPIAPLRAILEKFFYLTIFSNPFTQILSCLCISAFVYYIYRLILSRKII